MKFLVVLLFIGIVGPPARYIIKNNAWLPDLKYTPGKIATSDTSVICHRSTKDVRHTSATLKKHIRSEYGAVTGELGEVDHLVPLEDGGADDSLNLWFEPKTNAKYKTTIWNDYLVKDKVENWTHQQICKGTLNVKIVQKAFQKDWTILLKLQESKP